MRLLVVLNNSEMIATYLLTNRIVALTTSCSTSSTHFTDYNHDFLFTPSTNVSNYL